MAHSLPRLRDRDFQSVGRTCESQASRTAHPFRNGLLPFCMHRTVPTQLWGSCEEQRAVRESACSACNAKPAVVQSVVRNPRHPPNYTAMPCNPISQDSPWLPGPRKPSAMSHTPAMGHALPISHQLALFALVSAFEIGIIAKRTVPSLSISETGWFSSLGIHGESGPYLSTDTDQ
jgi:hypothetical protein